MSAERTYQIKTAIVMIFFLCTDKIPTTRKVQSEFEANKKNKRPIIL